MPLTIKIFTLVHLLMLADAFGEFIRPAAPFAPAAGQPGSTALAHDAEQFKSWATGYAHYAPGEQVEASWQIPARALGSAGNNAYDVCVLGRGGSLTLTFGTAIANGPGFDFAVFENGFSDTFLELAYVEVSSDGEHFARFPNYSLTSSPVGAFGHVQPTFVHGLAGKYRGGFGTPFDLQEIAEAYAHALTKEVWQGPADLEFSQEYRDGLVAAFPHLDLNAITHVRLIDIVGDGSGRDSEGFAIYDPFPTVITAGFDLDAIGVLNPREAQEPSQKFPQNIHLAPLRHLVAGEADYAISAIASSGLPVGVEIVQGPSGLQIETDPLRIGVGSQTGKALLRFFQNGNTLYAPAAELLIPLTVVEAGDRAAPRHFEEWAVSIFGSEVAPGEDPDADGLSNLWEFSSGTDPLMAGNGAVAALSFGSSPGASHRLVAEFRFNPSARQTIRFEQSDGSGFWTAAAPALLEVREEGTPPDTILIWRYEWSSWPNAERPLLGRAISVPEKK